MKSKFLVNLVDRHQEFEIPPDNSERKIGRSIDSDIKLENNYVSRDHATIVHHKDGTLYIWDNKSRNGTYIEVNGAYERIFKRTQIFNNQNIRIGVNMIFRIETRDIESERRAALRKSAQDTDLGIIKSCH